MKEDPRPASQQQQLFSSSQDEYDASSRSTTGEVEIHHQNARDDLYLQYEDAVKCLAEAIQKVDLTLKSGSNERDRTVLQAAQGFLEYESSRLVSWGSDVRIQTGSLDTVRGGLIPDLVSSVFQNIGVLLKRDAVAIAESQIELEDEISSLKPLVNTIRMSQALVSGKGPYDGLREGITSMAKEQRVKPEIAGQSSKPLLKAKRLRNSPVLYKAQELLEQGRPYRGDDYQTNSDALVPNRLQTKLLSPYEYEAFSSSDTFRLLKLRPASLHQDIDCELFETHLTTTDRFEEGVRDEDYEAVSWCWSGKLEERPLRINDGGRAYSFLISCELEAALKAFRYEDRARLLWVDAICIDQKSFKERNQQVPRMSQIFAQAKNICVWLGKEDETSSRAIRFMKEGVLKLLDSNELSAQLNQGERWQDMASLMARPWFSRRWIVQEIALAHHAVLYCGKDILLWQDFADATSLLIEVASLQDKLSNVMRKAESSERSFDLRRISGSRAAHLVDITNSVLRSSQHDNGKPRDRLLSLEYLVSKYTFLKAPEPRDTIYALLAIAKDTTPQPSQHTLFANFSLTTQRSLRSWITDSLNSRVYPVDYSAPVAEVYATFVQFAIRRSDPRRALDIICRNWAPFLSDEYDALPDTSDKTTAAWNPTSQPPALPSWIGALSGATFAMQEHEDTPTGESVMLRINADSLVGLPDEYTKAYSAAGTREVSLNRLKFINRGRYYSMFVEGFLLDKINTQEEISRIGIIPPGWLALVRWHHSFTDPPDEFCRTLVADRGLDGRNIPVHYSRACNEAMKKVQGGILDTSRIIAQGRPSIVVDFLRRVQAIIWNRRLIRTQNGHLGLVHQDAQAGDHICILYGCSVPVLLRRVPKSLADIDRERTEAGIEQHKNLQKPARGVSHAWNRGRKPKPSGLGFDRMNWGLVRLIWAMALFAFVQFRLDLDIKEVILINSPFIIFPQFLGSLEPKLNNEAWRQIRLWLRYARYVCVALLAIFVVSWIRLGTLGSILFVLSIVGLLPSLLLPEQGHRYIFSGLWLYALFHNSARRVLPEVAVDIPIPEPENCYWQLVGECYVNGMMDGEAITYQNEQNIGKQVFELR